VVNAVLDVFPRLSPWYCVCRSGQVRSRAAVVNAVLDVFSRLSSWYCVCRSGRVRSHAAVVNAVLDVFPRLSPWWKADDASVESKMTSLTLLMKLLSIDASVLSSSQHPACDVIWSMYTGLLTDSKTTLAFKVRSHLAINSSILLWLASNKSFEIKCFFKIHIEIIVNLTSVFFAEFSLMCFSLTLLWGVT